MQAVSVAVAQASGTGPSVFGLTFDRTVDAGAFLTFVTLVAAFLGWSYKTYREWRREEQRQAESGALRLLLKILRDLRGQAITPLKLKEKFNDDSMRDERKVYCGRNFKFKSGPGPDPGFDKAIYALQWESKVDFTKDDRLVLRTAFEDPRVPLPFDQAHVLGALKTALGEPKLDEFRIEKLVRFAMRIAPDETLSLLREALKTTAADSERSTQLMLGIAGTI